MSDKVTYKVKNYLSNPLLKRKQIMIEVQHPAAPCPSKSEVKSKLMEDYKVKDPKTIFLFGFKSKYGGGKTVGYGLIYDDQAAALKTEPRYRLIRNEMATTTETSRQNRKQRKNRIKRVRGKAKAEMKKKQ